MRTKDWYKLNFQIESNSEEIIIWKLTALGIVSYSFEYLLKTENQKKVNIWLPIVDWNKKLRNKLEFSIKELLSIDKSNNEFFNWSIIEEQDWLNSWKKYWKPELVGNNLLILPCWMRSNENYKNKKVIKIDPGAAFGTGSHPSTYLCLKKLESVFLSGKIVLDIGSGSGILGVTAKSFGASEICAIDNDYLAINSTKSNFQLNFGSLDYLNTYLGSFNEVIRKYHFKEFDFIVCNILAEVIKELIPNFSKCLSYQGEVILSGILNSQKDEIIEILNLNNLKLVDISSKKDWVCIAAQKI